MDNFKLFILNYENTRQKLAEFKKETKRIYKLCPLVESGNSNCISKLIENYNEHCEESSYPYMSIYEFFDNLENEDFCEHCRMVWERKHKKNELSMDHASSKRSLSALAKRIMKEEQV